MTAPRRPRGQFFNWLAVAQVLLLAAVLVLLGLYGWFWLFGPGAPDPVRGY